MKIKQALFAGLFLVVFSMANAGGRLLPGPTKPWDSEGLGYWGGAITATVGNFLKNDQKVTGTNVNFTVTVGASTAIPIWGPNTPTPPGTQSYNHFMLTELKIKVGGTTIYTGAGSSTPQSVSDGIKRHVRYASTNFGDNSTIEIVIDAKAEFSCVDDGSGNTVPSPYTITLPTLTITNKAYNKLISMATQDTSSSYIATADKACAGEAAGHIGSINHTVLAGSSPNYSVTKAGLITNLPLATVFFAAVHGNSSGMNDSVSGYTGGGTDFLTWSDFAYYISQGRISNVVTPSSYPLPYNMAISYVCGNDPSDLAGAFGLSGDDQGAAAFGGDLAIVATVVATNDITTIADHAHEVTNRLATGETLDDAVLHANQTIQTYATGVPITPLSMSVDGDGESKLRDVYKKSSETFTILAGGPTTWYLVY